MPEKYILLEDTAAHKQTFNWNPLAAKSYVDEHLLRGSLLVQLTDSEAKETPQYFAVPLNYKNYCDDSVKLYCTPEQVLQLNDDQFNLLLGVRYSYDRYKALNILHWVEKLTVGHGVGVTIPTIPHPERGVIRYKGSLPSEDGTKFGIELTERRGEGTGDGTFKNMVYFSCDRNCAMFVAMDKLSRSVDSSAKSSHAQEIVQPRPSLTQDVPVTFSDKVIFYDENDQPVNGVVRWIGRNKDILRDGSIVVGIEADKKVLVRSIPGNLHGINHMFRLNNSDGIKVFLPIDSILKDDSNNPPAATDTSSYPYNTRSKDEHGVVKVDPGATIGLKAYTKEEEIQFLMNSVCCNSATGMPYDYNGGKTDGTNQQESLHYSSPPYQPHKSLQYHITPDDNQNNPHNLEVGSMILYGDPPYSGMIKWIGRLPSIYYLMAGVEMDEYIKGSSDGVWNGDKYNDSQSGRGIFVPIIRLRPNAGFSRSNNSTVAAAAILPDIKNEEISASYKSDEAPTQTHHDLTNLENQVKQLQIDSHDSQPTALHQNVNEMEEQQKADIQKNTERIEVLEKAHVEFQTSNDYLKNLLNLTQQQLSDVQKSNEVLHKSNKLLQESNAHLKNQLSLTQQQLLGVQSMITYSRLWVVSHDQFTIGRELGRGAWASVHECTFRGATVAAKCLHQLLNAPRTRQLFQREMEMALQCQHQNIVTFLGATLDDPLVILMELMDTNLRSAYEQGHLRDHQVLRILNDTASALHFLHTRPDPVIHRDVSSVNVLLKTQYNGGWLAKLGDLGTAKIQQQAATAGPGTIAYGAPEAGDFTKHSPKMDVYSYGVLILEILTKTHPFQVVDDLKVQVQQQFPQYHQLVTSCTNQKSSDRPTMHDVIGQLDRITRA